jgi:hypothetical protein
MRDNTFGHLRHSVKYSPGIINSGGYLMEETVKIYCKHGPNQFVMSETNVEVFISKMKVSWIQGKCLITFATPKGGVEIELPQRSAIDMIESLIMMLPHEDVKELLAGLSEVMA